VAYVLVHGAWHGPWCWDAVAESLAGDGVAVHTVALPSVGEDPHALGDLYDDAAAVRAAIDGVDDPVVLVAHSYGGAPVTEGAAGAANVAHIVYVAAFMPDAGESLLGMVGGHEPDWWITAPDGLTFTPADPARLFYNDCAPEVAAAAAARIRPQNKVTSSQPLRRVAWREFPTTYVLCERDQALPPAAQEAMSGRAGAVSRLDCGHSPFLACPDDLVAIIGGVASA
jgi:pimeloyl-ACP methyl ester carboxylesterase